MSKEIALSEEQQLCLQTDKNIVVSAGAGSGKTTVLAHRFLALVKKGIPAHKILTLTFTRKATAEMEERILRILHNNQAHPAVKSALSANESLNICTLDSFCLKILKNGGSRFKLPTTISVSMHTFSLKKSCQKFIYEHRDHPVLCRLLQKNRRVDPFPALLESLFMPLAREHCPLFPGKSFSQRAENIIEWIEQQAEQRQKDFLPYLHRIMHVPASPKVLALQETIHPLMEEHRYAEIARHLHDLDLRTHFRDSSETSKEMKGIILQSRGERSKSDRSPIGLFLHAKALTTLKKDFRHLYALLTEFQEYICQEKLSNEQLSFSDIMALALHILREDHTVRHYFQQSFDAIIADEFQDNNRKQRDLLLLLSQDPSSKTKALREEDIPQGKLFLVGDERQAIYRFRGAEVRLFRQLQQRLSDSGGTQLHLSTNYRSTPALVTFFNTLFQDVFSGPPMRSALPSQPSPRVVLAYHIQSTEDRPREREALWVAERISMLLDENCTDASFQPSDIAILLPTSTHKQQFERTLQERNIPFYSSSMHGFFREAPVNDLRHLMDVLFYPRNRESYAALLRSPLVNLSDEALLTILNTSAEPFAAQVELSPTDQEKYTQSQSMFRTLQAEFFHMTPIRFVHYFWYRLGYRYYLLASPARHGLLPHYDLLLTLAASCSSMGQFYTALRTETPIQREESFAPGVQIMTIHASKGLEFPVVFVCDMASAGKKEGNPPYLVDPVLGPIINISPPEEDNSYLLQYKQQQDQQEKLEELQHLLYVSTTRAASQLFYTASLSTRSLSKPKLPASLFHLLQDIIQFTIEPPHMTEKFSDLIELIPIPEQKKISHTTSKADIHQAQRMLDHIPPTIPAKPLRYLSATFLNIRINSKDPVPHISPQRMRTEQSESLQLGTLAHNLIEWRLHHPDHAITQDILEAHGFLQEILPSKKTLLVDKAVSLSEYFFSSRFWHEHQHLPRESEVDIVWKYTGFSPHYFITGRVDLLIDCGTENIVVDFKTDLRVRPESYALQMTLYHQAVHHLTQKPVKVFLAFLHAQKIVPAPQVNLDQILPPLIRRLHEGTYLSDEPASEPAYPHV